MLFNPQKARNYDGTELNVVNQNNREMYRWRVDPDIYIDFVVDGNTFLLANICNIEVMTIDGVIPELRYNTILDRWFCATPEDVSANDLTTEEKEAEFLTKACKAESTSAMFSSAIEAIAHWNQIAIDWVWASSYMLIMDPRECLL